MDQWSKRCNADGSTKALLFRYDVVDAPNRLALTEPSRGGKPEFDDEIENPAFEGSPELTIERSVEADDTIVVTGTGVGHHRAAGRFEFAYCDVFTFRGGLIAEVESYVVPIS